MAILYSFVMGNLDGKKILITGGTTGIGRATAVRLAREGANVMVFGRHEKELRDALADIKRLVGHRVHGLTADVTILESVRHVFEEIDSRWGKLDVLINNAGLPVRSITNTDFDQLYYVLQTNIAGYLVCAKMALERMLPKGSGHIVNIGSMSAYTRDADTDLYVATKSAIAGFNESLRKLVSPKCIKVTIIEPGSVGTDMVCETSEEQKKCQDNETLLRAEDIAEAISFALLQPKRVDILKIQLRAHRQVF